MTGPKRRSPAVQFLAWLMMAVGALIFATSGACSVFFLFSVASDGPSTYFGDLGSVILMVLTLGGIPFLIGLALFFGGRRLARPPKRPAPATPATEHDDEPTTGA